MGDQSYQRFLLFNQLSLLIQSESNSDQKKTYTDLHLNDMTKVAKCLGSRLLFDVVSNTRLAKIEFQLKSTDTYIEITYADIDSFSRGTVHLSKDFPGFNISISMLNGFNSTRVAETIDSYLFSGPLFMSCKHPKPGSLH